MNYEWFLFSLETWLFTTEIKSMIKVETSRMEETQ